MATETDPYFALPKLYGAPAYARPPRVVDEAERPFDPDDLPIAAEQTAEERAFAQIVLGSTPATASWGEGGSTGGSGERGDGTSARRFSLRALSGRLGPRQP